jgi:hypothetical protein
MVLLDGDPLADLAQLRQVRLTLRGDRYYRAAELHQAIGVRRFVQTDAVAAAATAGD